MDLIGTVPLRNGLIPEEAAEATAAISGASVSARMVRYARNGSISAAILVGALAFTALMGWILDTPPLPFPPAIISINPVNAFGLLMASISLLLLPRIGLTRNPLHLGEALAFAVLLIGLLKLLSVAFHWNTDIDNWFFANRPTEPSNLVRRFAPKMALAFFLMGGGLLLLRRERAFRWSQLLGFFVTAIGLLCLQGYAFGLLEYHTMPHMVLMSALSGFALTLMGIAILFAQTEQGAMGLIASNTDGGFLARRLLPAAIILPIALGLLSGAGEGSGWYSSRLGLAMFATAFVIFFVAVIWWTARLLHRLDLKRREAEFLTRNSEERVRRLNLELERRITERTAALETASVANRDLEAFSYSVSHDLRAPLRAIAGFSRILVEDQATELDAEGLRYLNLIEHNAQQMGQLIDDLLTFSQAGRQALRIQTVNTAEVVKACLADLEGMKKNRQITIAVGALPNCEADGSLLRQIWLNLLSNALKFTGKCNPAVITIGSRKEAGVDSYFVRDNGAGFDMKYADKLFGVFQRLHLADEYEGTGVGLALVQRIVQRHGGRLWTEAKLNLGATFHFTLTGGQVV